MGDAWARRRGSGQANKSERNGTACRGDSWSDLACERGEGFPLISSKSKITISLILLSGEFRISQNWIGDASIVDAVFVPPAADKLSDVTSLSTPFVLNIEEHIREDGLSKTVFLKAGSLVLSNSATLRIPKILDLDTCIHDGWLYFPKSQLSNEYLYLLFKEIRPQLINLGNGSIFTNLKTDILRNYEVTLPNKETLSNFQNIIKPIFEKMLFIQRETKQLEIIRDTLLPKLMSGEIDVESVKI